MNLRLDVFVNFVPPGDNPILAKLGLMHATLNAVSGAQTKMATTMEQVKEGMDTLKTEIGTTLAERDALIVQLRADVATATAAAGISPSEQADIDSLFAKEAEARALLVPAGVVVPPAVDGGTATA